MIPKIKTFPFFFILASFVVICPVSASIVLAAALNVNVQNSQINLNAREVPLIDLLKIISEKTEIIIESSDPLTERMSLTLEGASIEECLRRLLGKRNYVLTYNKTADGQIVPAAVHVFGTGSKTLIAPDTESEPSVPLTESLKKIEKKSFEQTFGDGEKLVKQISATQATGSPEYSGIKLTKIQKDSFFSNIGLKTGDIVQDVNGQQVESAEEFIEALQAAIEDENMIRIARVNNNSLFEPIYIELH